jgi:hypothetical protein
MGEDETEQLARIAAAQSTEDADFLARLFGAREEWHTAAVVNGWLAGLFALLVLCALVTGHLR